MGPFCPRCTGPPPFTHLCPAIQKLKLKWSVCNSRHLIISLQRRWTAHMHAIKMSTSAGFTVSFFFFSRKAKENVSASITTWLGVHMLLGFSVHSNWVCLHCVDISQVPLLLCSFTLIILQCTNVSTVLLEVFTRVGVDAWALWHRLKVFSEVEYLWPLGQVHERV